MLSYLDSTCTVAGYLIECACYLLNLGQVKPLKLSSCLGSLLLYFSCSPIPHEKSLTAPMPTRVCTCLPSTFVTLRHHQAVQVHLFETSRSSDSVYEKAYWSHQENPPMRALGCLLFVIGPRCEVFDPGCYFRRIMLCHST